MIFADVLDQVEMCNAGINSGSWAGECELTYQLVSGHEAAHDAGGGALGGGQTNDLLSQILGHRTDLQDVKLPGIEEVCGSHAGLTGIDIHP